MNRIIQIIEETVNAIKDSELRKNPKASAKAFEIRRMIVELKKHVAINSQDSTNQGVLRYINPKALFEN